MPILALLGLILIIALVFGPSWLVRRTMARNADDRPDLPGTGGELARHLLDRAGLSEVRVETTEIGDHYDPEARVVRLLPLNFFGRSVTAVAVATHEVSHAMQDAEGDALFVWRTRLAKIAIALNSLAVFALIAAVPLALIVRSPTILLSQFGIAIALMGMGLLVHLITLPVELDASFGKALPILARGGYLPDEDIPAARAVLRAAAFTYVAGALVGLLNFLRLLRLIRP